MHFLHCILDNTQRMTSEKPTLYSFYRSSCSWRVRIALNLKKIEYEYAPINLLKGEQKSESYLSINPLGGLPTLKINDHYISQSISIMEYLDEVYPEVPLLPKNDPIKRADVRKLCLIIAADTQPIQKVRVLKYVGDERKMDFGHWAIEAGLRAFEKCLENTSGKYCYGDEITMADICLIPQMLKARRFKVDVSKFVNICRIEEELNKLDAFIQAHPTNQMDCPIEWTGN